MQPDLFTRTPVFDSGVELTTSDHVRLGSQLHRVLEVLEDHDWWTVQAICDHIYLTYGIKDRETSVSAQCRNLRKPKHGGYDIQRRRVNNTYEFRLTPEGEV